MTKRQPPRPDGLNRNGNGKGLKVVTRPVTKKRGASVDRTAPVANNRAKYRSASCIPVAELATTIDPDKPLTEKAKLFVKYWAQGESVASAAVKAGYGDGASYAYRLVHFPQAIALYNKEKAAYEAAAQMTRKKVMDGLLEGIEMCRLTSDGPGVITGWKTVGQMCGYFEPRKRQLDINITGNARMNQMSDADLLRIIQQGAAAELEMIEQAPEEDE
jgi:Terminase small subunit